ncbi:hypothetical protein HDV00_002791 [Rhizophlyctis rosea]|nr:hypothetical protein HDV00_002791 [Rhizophlyctis rosea]
MAAGAVETFLSGREELNLTKYADANVWDNYLWVVDVWKNEKTDVLKYLDGDGEAPELFATAYIVAGARHNPRIEVYKVGPLTTPPDLSKISYTLLTDDIPHNSRVEDSASYKSLTPFVAEKITIPLAKVTKALFNATFYGKSDGSDTLTWQDVSPKSTDGSLRRSWIFFNRDSEGSYILPTGLYARVDHSGTNPFKWNVLKIVYGTSQVFSSVNDFIHAYDTGTLTHIPIPSDPSWATLPRPAKERKKPTPPRQVPTDRPRYTVDLKTHHVKWLDWQFYWTFSRETGLVLWDVRFKNERVLYEMGLQEAVTHYAAADPGQGNSAYLDRFIGFGTTSFSLLPDYDCPAYGTLVNVDFYDEKVATHCFAFMKWIGRLEYYGATKDVVLGVRVIHTTGNYDYVVDYLFHPDGTIEHETSYTGYPQAGIWDPKTQQPFTTRIHDESAAAIHDHMTNYKLDLDLLTTSNTPVWRTLNVTEYTPAWADDSDALNPKKRVEKRLVTKDIKNEDEGKIDFDNWGNRDGMVLFVNKDRKNAWGYDRGYRLELMAPIRDIVPDNGLLRRSGDVAKHHLTITKYHSSEHESSHSLNQQLTDRPFVPFAKYSNGESLEQENPVAWVNIGIHHIPRAEDVPLTLTNTARGGWLLEPINWDDHGHAGWKWDEVYIEANKEGQVVSVEGSEAGKGCRVGKFQDGLKPEEV